MFCPTKYHARFWNLLNYRYHATHPGLVDKMSNVSCALNNVDKMEPILYTYII